VISNRKKEDLILIDNLI